VINSIINDLIILGLIFPIIIYAFNNKKKNYFNILLFFLSFMMCSILNSLPELCNAFNISDGKWNWEGKIISFLGAILFIIIFNKRFKSNNFFTLKQKKDSIKPIIIVVILLLISGTLFTYLSAEKNDFNLETLAFQISIPGLDEEFYFRGIMIGLLLSSLNNSLCIGKVKLGNPAIWITGILFGLVHGFHMTFDWQVRFDYFSFGYAFLFGSIWGWMAIKSRSILMPLISHNINNFTFTLLTMIK